MRDSNVRRHALSRQRKLRRNQRLQSAALGSRATSEAAQSGNQHSLDWWPDWTGETCLIVASGPSAKEVPLDLARGRVKAIAINESWQLAPWADVLWGVDRGWWKLRNGVPAFGGLKIGWGTNLPDIKHVEMGEPHTISTRKGYVAKSNSGMGAINLAVGFGAKKIILVGYDCRVSDGVHWHGRHPQLSNPSEVVAKRWATRLDNQAEMLRHLGVQVINCSKDSAITKFPKRRFEEAISCLRADSTGL